MWISVPVSLNQEERSISNPLGPNEGRCRREMRGTPGIRGAERCSAISDPSSLSSSCRDDLELRGEVGTLI